MVTEAGSVPFVASQRAYCVSSQTCFVKKKVHSVFTASCCFPLFMQVTETRTGPLGCSNYDNLDTVSSVLVHSPENKVQLQGKTLAVIWILFFYMYDSFLKMCIFHSVSSNTHTLLPHPHPSPRAAGRPPELLAEPLHTGGSKLHRLQVRRPVCLPERGLLVRVQCGLSAV